MINRWEVESVYCSRIWKCQWLAFLESPAVRTMVMAFTTIIRCTHQSLWRGSYDTKKQEPQSFLAVVTVAASKILSPGARVAVLLVAACTVQCWCYRWYQLPCPCLLRAVLVSWSCQFCGVWFGYCFCLFSVGSDPCALLLLWFCELLIHSFLLKLARACLCAAKNPDEYKMLKRHLDIRPRT